MAKACVLLAAVGAVRILYFHFLHEDPRELPAAYAARIDDRYRGLSKVLPPRGKIVYLSDEPTGSPQGVRLYVQALYALAPRILVKDDGTTRTAIADLSDGGKLDEIARLSGFRTVARFDGGTALLERAAR
jgi:hypothetical protein